MLSRGTESRTRGDTIIFRPEYGVGLRYSMFTPWVPPQWTLLYATLKLERNESSVKWWRGAVHYDMNDFLM